MERFLSATLFKPVLGNYHESEFIPFLPPSHRGRDKKTGTGKSNEFRSKFFEDNPEY